MVVIEISAQVAFIDDEGLPDVKITTLEYEYEPPYDNDKFRAWVVSTMKEKRWRLIDLRQQSSHPK